MKLDLKVKNYLAAIKKENKRINAFLEVRDEEELLSEARAIESKKNKGKLAGVVIGIKSNINVLGMTCSCASKTLEDYKATYDATVVRKIKEEDGLIIGITNCDEFAAGSSGENSAFGPTENPRVPGHVSGGSSSGSAAAVAAGFCDVALGSDTGGSIRVPASFCGIVGIKPSYGLVSRYGLVDLAMSLDQIGVFARTVEEASLVLEVIKGEDGNDTTTFPSKEIHLSKPSNVKAGIVSVEGINGEISKLFDTFVKMLKEKSWKCSSLTINHLDLAVQTYHPIVWTEFFSATRRFDGRKYGKKIEDSAGAEVLRRIFGGSEVSKAEFEGRYYHKALEVKQLIADEFTQAFEKVDCLLMPTAAVLPWKLGAKMSVKELYAVDALVIPANLAGVCALSLPLGEVNGKPVGVQVICGKGSESLMLSLALEIEHFLKSKL